MRTKVLNSDRIQLEPPPDQHIALPPQESELGAFWRQWFGAVGQHATVDVVHATTKLVMAEREIAVRDAASPTQAALEACEVLNAYQGDSQLVVLRKSDWDALVESVKGEK